MTIPASQFVSVVPSVLSAGSPPLSMTGLLLLGTDTSIPIGTVQSFASSPAVTSWFGATSNQAYLAGIYFQGYTGCTQLPGNILMAQWNSVAVAGWLRGGSMAAVALTTLQGYSGTISIHINGTAYTTGTINLSSATSFSNAASLIQSALTAVSAPATCTFDALRSGFLITSSTTGSTSSVAFPTDSSLSPDLFLQQAQGAVISAGAAATTPAALMSSITAITQNWASFMTDSIPSLSNMEAFASWVTTQEQQFVYIAYDNNVTAQTANQSTVFGSITSAYNGVYAIWNPAGDKAAFVMGTIASINFNATNGRITFAYRQSPAGLTPDITNQTVYQALLTNFYDSYVSVGTGSSILQWLQDGHVSGTWLWLDSYVNQIYFNAAFQAALLNLLSSANRIPFNFQGVATITSALQTVINQMLTFGAAVAGTTLSGSQAAIVNAATNTNAAQAIQNYGYFLYIPIPSATVQQERGPWPITLYYADGEALQTINMGSIDVE
jgi:Protein of unknown function (DUF3383)